jgi:hypothetical protein
VPVTFTNLDQPYQRYWRASLRGPDNTVLEAVTADYVFEGQHVYLSDVGDIIGNHWITVKYAKDGRWTTNADNPRGFCDGAWRLPCRRIFRPEGLGSTIYDPCAERIQVPVRAPDCVVDCLPRTQIYDFVGQAIAQTRAGTVRTAPGNDRGLVNLPDCGWIEGANGTVQRQFVFAVAGPPDPSGRSVRYQYVVTVGPLAVQWNYDDPDQPGFQPGDFGQAWTTGGLCTNPHRYRRISDWNPNQRAHITVRQTYGAWVNVVWYDGATPRQREVGELEQTFTIWATPSDQFVGQVEGIPTND